jgi:hypothetical protein
MIPSSVMFNWRWSICCWSRRALSWRASWLNSSGEDEAHGVSIILTNENSMFQSCTNGSDFEKTRTWSWSSKVRFEDQSFITARMSEPYGLVDLKGGKYSPAHGNRQSAMYGSQPRCASRTGHCAVMHVYWHANSIRRNYSFTTIIYRLL